MKTLLFWLAITLLICFTQGCFWHKQYIDNAQSKTTSNHTSCHSKSEVLSPAPMEFSNEYPHSWPPDFGSFLAYHSDSLLLATIQESSTTLSAEEVGLIWHLLDYTSIYVFDMKTSNSFDCVMLLNNYLEKLSHLFWQEVILKQGAVLKQSLEEIEQQEFALRQNLDRIERLVKGRDPYTYVDSVAHYEKEYVQLVEKGELTRLEARGLVNYGLSVVETARLIE